MEVSLYRPLGPFFRNLIVRNRLLVHLIQHYLQAHFSFDSNPNPLKNHQNNHQCHHRHHLFKDSKWIIWENRKKNPIKIRFGIIFSIKLLWYPSSVSWSSTDGFEYPGNHKRKIEISLGFNKFSPVFFEVNNKNNWFHIYWQWQKRTKFSEASMRVLLKGHARNI